MMVTAMRHSGISEKSGQVIHHQVRKPADAMRVKPVAKPATANNLSLAPVNALTLTKRNQQAGG